MMCREALRYPRYNRKEFEGRFLGLIPYLNPKGEQGNSMVRREAPRRWCDGFPEFQPM